MDGLSGGLIAGPIKMYYIYMLNRGALRLPIDGAPVWPYIGKHNGLS